jgi:hypothetical protein
MIQDGATTIVEQAVTAGDPGRNRTSYRFRVKEAR